MTNEQVLASMTKEIEMWYDWQQLEPMCVEEALIEYNETLTVYQRSYLNDFLLRWISFER